MIIHSDMSHDQYASLIRQKANGGLGHRELEVYNVW